VTDSIHLAAGCGTDGEMEKAGIGGQELQMEKWKKAGIGGQELQMEKWKRRALAGKSYRWRNGKGGHWRARVTDGEMEKAGIGRQE